MVFEGSSKTFNLLLYNSPTMPSRTNEAWLSDLRNNGAEREAALEQIRFFLRHQHGMILVVGPTGSGKTTTLSSALSSMRSGITNIITIEDPIEYQIPGVNQTQVNEKAKLTFAAALRAILRQDPDVVLVGEMRDQETVEIGLRAGLEVEVGPVIEVFDRIIWETRTSPPSPAPTMSARVREPA